MSEPISAYRKAENDFRGQPDQFWEYLERNKHEDWTLCIGWALRRADRFYNLDQQQVAERTAVVDSNGQVLVPPVSKSFLSAMLTGRSKVAPDVYTRLADACGVNPVEFYLAERWLSPAQVAAYQMPERELVLPILTKLTAIGRSEQPAALAVVLSVLDSLKAAAERMATRQESAAQRQ